MFSTQEEKLRYYPVSHTSYTFPSSETMTDSLKAKSVMLVEFNYLIKKSIKAGSGGMVIDVWINLNYKLK